MHVLGNFAVIVTHDGDVLGNSKAQFAKRIVATDGHHVVGAEDGGWGHGQRQKGAHSQITGRRLPIAVVQEVPVEGQVRFCKRSFIAMES